MEDIRNLIASNRTDEAFDVLEQLLEEKKLNHELDGLYLLKSQYSRWKDKDLKGIQPPASDLIRIEKGILAIYKKIKIQEKKYENTKKNPIPLLNYAIAFVGIIGLALLAVFLKPDLISNKNQDAITELRRNSIVNFYKDAKPKLNKIDVLFEAYCNFQDNASRDGLDDALADFYTFRKNAQFIADDLLTSLADYNNFVAEKSYEIESESLTSDEVSSIFKDSQVLLQDAMKLIERELNNL